MSKRAFVTLGIKGTIDLKLCTCSRIDTSSQAFILKMKQCLLNSLEFSCIAFLLCYMTS